MLDHESSVPSPSSPRLEIDPEISLTDSTATNGTLPISISPPNFGCGSVLFRYFEQVKKTVDEFAEDVNFAEMRPEHDLDSDEANVRLRIAGARIPRIQHRMDKLVEKEAALTRTLLDMKQEDPNHIMEKIDALIVSFERSKQSLHQKLANRPILRDEVFPPSSPPNSNTGSNLKFANDFDASKYVTPKFNGEIADEECLQKFSKWKMSWDLAHEELRTLSGYSSEVAFNKLSSVLEEAALKKIRHINPQSPSAYELAINKLETLYMDKISLATNYLTSLGEVKGSNQILATEFQASLIGLENIQETFIDEKVDPFQFTILLHFQTLMDSRPAMAESWLHFKKCRQQKLHPNQSGRIWHTRMAEDFSTFKAWLDEFRASQNVSKDQISSSNVQKKSRSKDHCFVCKGSHRPFKCPIAVTFSYAEWLKACQDKNKCKKCLNEWTQKHVCTRTCNFCGGGHNEVLCPENRHRIKKRPHSPSPDGRSCKTSRNYHHDQDRDRNIDRYRSYSRDSNSCRSRGRDRIRGRYTSGDSGFKKERAPSQSSDTLRNSYQDHRNSGYTSRSRAYHEEQRDRRD